jgi:integrase
MPKHMYPRGKLKILYANCRYMGVYIRDCLGTSDERLAERRLAELKYAVERGDYRAYKKWFEDVAQEFLKTAGITVEEKAIARNHLIPYFSKLRIGEITEYEVFKWFETVNARPESTLKKWQRCLNKIVLIGNRQFQMPKMSCPNKGKKFDATQILEEWEVLRIIHEFVPEKYRLPCLIASYSALRLGNVVSTKTPGGKIITPGLRKGDVDLKRGYIKTRQVKTFLPVYIPMSDKIREVFSQIKVWPLAESDEFFPHLKGKNVTRAVLRAVIKAGYPRGGFHIFRHFAACFMINAGVPLEVIREIMGHKDFKSTLVYAQLKPATLEKHIKVFDQEVYANCITSGSKSIKDGI